MYIMKIINRLINYLVLKYYLKIGQLHILGRRLMILKKQNSILKKVKKNFYVVF
nr:MAG TPA: hypothetical protein [Caudoviricetes sp.]